MVDKDKILDDLEKLFDADVVDIKREGDRIEFSKKLYDTVALGDNLKKDLVDVGYELFTVAVIINDDNTYTTMDIVDKSNMSGGSLGLSGESTREVGEKKIYKGFYGVIGFDKDTGEKGIITKTWDCNELKKPIFNRLNSLGLTKKKATVDQQFKELGKGFMINKKQLATVLIIFAIFGILAIICFILEQLGIIY